MKRVFVLLILVLFLSSCASLETVKHSRGKGVARTYNYSYDKVYKATSNSVYRQGAQIVGQSKEEGYFFLSHGLTWWSWGERTAIFLDRVNDNTTKVEIISRKIVSPLNFAPDWAEEIFKVLELELQEK